MVAKTLNLAARIQSPTGWINLQDPAGGYEIDATAFAERSVSHRKTEVSSGWMEGTFVARSVRENINETLAVQVRGSTPVELTARVAALTDAFEQIAYQVIVSFDQDQSIWQCTVADYVITTSREYRFSLLAVVKATVPRLPSPYNRSMIPGTPPGEPGSTPTVGFWILDDIEQSQLGVTTILV